MGGLHSQEGRLAKRMRMLNFGMAVEAKMVEVRIVMFREIAMDLDTSIGTIKSVLLQDFNLNNRHAKRVSQLLKNQTHGEYFFLKNLPEAVYIPNLQKLLAIDKSWIFISTYEPKKWL